MQALRLNEVLTRVVAWHNRHPLARRISASQVHSIGEVVLPFASAQPARLASAPAPAHAPPTIQDLLGPPASALAELPAPGHSDPIDSHPADQAASATAAALTDPIVEPDSMHDNEAPAQADLPGATDSAATEPAPVLSMEDEADDLFSADAPPAGPPAPPDDDAPEMLIELSSDADEPTPIPSADSAALAAAFAAATDDDTAPPADRDDAAVPDQHLPAHAPTGLSGDGTVVPAAADPHPNPAAAPTNDADANQTAEPRHSAALAPPAGLLARLWAQAQGWRLGGALGLPRLQATFSRDFIWPLRPGQVARWARRYGSLAPLAPADWPQRLIDTDGSLLAQARGQGLTHALPLHLLTAAIGVGDRRIRVLIDAQGQVLGPRSYSPPKLAALAGLLALGLVGAGWGWLPQGDSRNAQQTRAVVAAVAAAAAQAASAAEMAAAAAAVADRVWRAQQADLLRADSTPADAPPDDTSQTGAPDNPQPDPGQAVPMAHGSDAVASADDAATAPHPTPAQDTSAGPAPHKAVVPLGTFVVELSAADKLAARRQVEAARISQAAAIAAQPLKPAVPVFAVVTLPTRERDSAARGLSLIRASGQRLVGELPERGELLQNQGEWRAAWWPFDSQADAERARVMLAARGLKVEVVEF